MWQARTKKDLVIEVWEKLDCENVGAREILAIEKVVRDQYGEQAVDSPMRVARLLADEGAELRHSEIMELWVEGHRGVPYGAEFLNLSKFSNFDEARSTLRNYENLRRKFLTEGDKEGIRRLREEAIAAKKNIASENNEAGPEQTEIAEWITIWLQSPEIFENWIDLRRNSAAFIAKFGRSAE